MLAGSGSGSAHLQVVVVRAAAAVRVSPAVFVQVENAAQRAEEAPLWNHELLTCRGAEPHARLTPPPHQRVFKILTPQTGFSPTGRRGSDFLVRFRSTER